MDCGAKGETTINGIIITEDSTELDSKLSAIETAGRAVIEKKKAMEIAKHNYEQAGLRLKPSQYDFSKAMDEFRDL